MSLQPHKNHRYIDLNGKRFGKLTVISFCQNKGRKKWQKRIGAYWKCQCDCGKIIKVRSHSLRTGKTKSCGKACSASLVGKRFGKVVVIKRIGIRYVGKTYRDAFYRCKCDCGNIVTFTRSQLKHHIQVAMCSNCRCPDLTGRKINKLYVIKKSRIRTRGRTYWKCRCDCGKIKNIEGSQLRIKHPVISCGCHRKYIRSGKRSNLWVNGGWAGGKLSKIAQQRLGPKRDRWRRSVLRHDNYTCQCCGFVSKNKKGLAAHHRYSFIDNYKKRFKVSNGITLCKRCHLGFHSRYGFGRNNPWQFAYFKKISL